MSIADHPSLGGTASSIPTGTVTFLFTDIEGSTRLLERLRHEYADLLAEQRLLLRAAFAEWNGFEVDTQGDSFFVAFPRAVDALQCTVEAQRAIAAHSWPQGVKLRVRMALHTGEPLVQRTGYVGMDVHRAARIGSAAHGGQILVSGSTRELVTADMPTGMDLIGLGSYRLKDVRLPVELYQVRADGLPVDFPPLHTVSSGEEPPTAGESPFKGLEFFDEADARLFFGRETLTDELVTVLASGRFLAVVGASGSGKSSLARAGIVPAIRGQTDTDWTIRTLTPTARPLEALALALTGGESSADGSSSPRETAMLIDDLAADRRTLHLFASQRPRSGRRHHQRILLVVDQFEEVFTLSRDEAERASFLDNLLTAVEGDGPVSVLLTLRADFYDRLAAHDGLRTAVAEHQRYIGPMSSEELRRAIEAPAQAGGWEFSPGLVDLILHDVGEEPGALPLLSHALLETWRRRRGNVMTLKAYAESGGVRGAIARTADRVYHAELDASQQEIARSIFLRLTELGEGNQDTRRRVALRELMPADEAEGGAVSAVLGRLVDARLVTTNADTAEVAHEALIREWPTLREWLSHDRDALRVHRHLTESTQEWELLERDPGALYRGARLANAVEWATDHPEALNMEEDAFLHASRDQETREDDDRESQRRREIEAAEQLAASEAASHRRLRRRAVLLTGALVVAVVMAGAAVVLGMQGQQSAAEAERNFAKAESQRLAGESSTLLQLQGSSEVAALLALRGLDANYSPQADMSLQRASRLDLGRNWLPSTKPVDALDVSPDGAHVITIARDGVARLWNVATGDLEREYQVGNTFSWPILFSPDGTRFLVSAEEGVSVWDLATGARVFTADAGWEADFSADGSQVYIARGDKVDVVDIASGGIIRTMRVPSESLQVFPDGDRLITSSGNDAFISDARTGAVIHQLSGFGSTKHVAVSPDGRYVATGDQHKTAKVWDTGTGQLVQTLVGHSEILFGIAFSPDGSKLLTGSLDNTARLWDIASGKEIRRLTGHTAAVYAVGFTPDGRYAITSSADKSARIWDLTSPLEADTLVGQTSFVYAVDFSPDGSRIFTGSDDGTGLLWDTSTHQVVSRLYTDSRVDAAAFSPDGRYLLLGHNDKKAELWDVASGRLVRVLRGSSGGSSAGFSADGRLLLAAAASTHGPAVGVWDVATGKFLRIFHSEGDGRAVLSPDGRYVAIGLDEAKDNLRIFDAATGDLLRVLTSGTGATAIAFAPDSRHVLTGSRDNIGRIIDVETGDTRELIGHTNIMWGAAFSPDGRYALTGSQDRTARLWDVGTGAEVRRFASHQYSAIAGVAFSADGKTIGIGNFDGFTQLTPTDLPALVSSTCARLLRDFGPSERLIYEIPDEPATCATSSISTRAPLGSAATPTVDRAGGGSPTNLP